MLIVRWLFLIGLALSLIGCPSSQTLIKPTPENRYSLIAPGPISIGSITFNNPGHWSQQIQGGVTSWTKDGILLNEIVFSRTKQGQNILGKKIKAAGDFEFNPAMSMNLVVEQFTDALRNSSYHNVKLLERSRLQITNRQAVKFKINYDAGSNVNYSAWALFIKDNGNLITIFCSAPSRYYFPKLELSYLKVLDSIRLN